LVFGRAGTLIAAGGGLGLVISIGVGQLVASNLNGIPPSDRLTLVTVAAVIAAIGGLAAWLPAERAARVDPIVVLREE
jgi:ABC-type antimicrobial peptide transport system permease subunit